jgi:hypothetical protein
VVHLTIGTTTTNYYDPNQILNTKGADAAGCPYTGTRNDESQAWQQLSSNVPAIASAAMGEASSLELPLAPEVWMSPPFPNPAGQELTIRFGMPTAGDVRLAIYDIAGRLVRGSVGGTLSAGSYMDVVDLTGFKPGSYFCTLWTPSRTIRHSFVIAR